MERRISDPEGAITAARALLESACKHVLDELQAPYPTTPIQGSCGRCVPTI